ncbi:tetratricopeptide repeat protein [Sphingomonas crocodyli]|uniref:Tetratricopeptide repeat protein n=1 Tax=Sphingomonas crocodyli TaxID=1979270 RepID=A0A437MA43_9SPHN|nr:tetratricopeptide repeat protein [Sphingomonas crocodyli]RVT94501.1 tetratricopeptide repeat protein [Sphingomonas crocodyli]
MNNSEPAKPRFTLSFGRVALLLAALIAVVAVGITQYRKYKSADPETSTDSSAPAGPVADVATMIASLEKRLQSNPNDAEGWNMLGWSYYSTGRYADSAAAYRHAIDIDPKNATYWSALGEVEVLSGPGGITPKATEAFGKALAIDPKDFRARYFMGVKKDQDGKHQEAIDDWIALVQEAPAGAPWEDAVRDLIDKASKEHKIDVAGRVPPKRVAPMADVGGGMGGMPVTGSGAQVATDGIPGPSAGDMQAAAGMTTGQQNEMIAGMVGRLAARLKANPKDGDGWIRLMRARMVLNDPAAARQALADGKAAFAGDKAELARLDEAAKALGVQ